MASKVLIPVFTGVFMLMFGIIFGNPSDRKLAQENSKSLQEIKVSIAVIEMQVTIAHPNKFSKLDSRK